MRFKTIKDRLAQVLNITHAHYVATLAGMVQDAITKAMDPFETADTFRVVAALYGSMLREAQERAANERISDAQRAVAAELVDQMPAIAAAMAAPLTEDERPVSEPRGDVANLIAALAAAGGSIQ